MASEAQTDRLEGNTELVRVDYETLTFRGLEVLAIVDRGMDARGVANGLVDFTERDMTRIEVLRSAVDEIPRVGESFTDEDGRLHRIELVRRTDNTYRCDCVPSTAP